MSKKPAGNRAVIEYVSPTAQRSRNLAVLATACVIVFFPLPILFPLFAPLSSKLAEVMLYSASLGSILLFFFAYTLYRMNKNTRILVSDSGIVLPGYASAFEKDSSVLPWKSVERLAVTESDNPSNASLVMYLKVASPVRLKLKTFSSENLDKLVSACDLWADDSIKDSTFSTLVETVTHKRLDNSDSTFTALWLEEAQRRLSSTPFEPLSPGSSLQSSRVKVVQPLTAGGWSAIYLCTWKETTQAILKEAVVPSGAKEEVKRKAHEQFEREAILLSGIDHPQITSVLDYFVEDGRQYMVLRRINGANLRSYIKDKGSVSQRQALRWAIELANILVYLHGKEVPIVHRDITPENLVLDMKGSLVLIDFGAANEFVGTVTGTLVGKPSYIAPEQFSGHATLKSDLYSMGAVIYFMLAGDDPEALTVPDLKQSSFAKNAELSALVSEMMQLDSTKRISSAIEVRDKLLSIAEKHEED